MTVTDYKPLTKTLDASTGRDPQTKGEYLPISAQEADRIGEFLPRDEAKMALPDAHLTGGGGAGAATDMIKILTGTEGVDAVFICNKVPDCDYLHRNFNSLFAHLSGHAQHGGGEVRENKQQLNQGTKQRSRLALKLADNAERLVDLAAQVEAMELGAAAPKEIQKANDDRDAWKGRALKAETELKAIKKSLANLGMLTKLITE